MAYKEGKDGKGDQEKHASQINCTSSQSYRLQAPVSSPILLKHCHCFSIYSCQCSICFLSSHKHTCKAGEIFQCIASHRKQAWQRIALDILAETSRLQACLEGYVYQYMRLSAFLPWRDGKAQHTVWEVATVWNIESGIVFRSNCLQSFALQYHEGKFLYAFQLSSYSPSYCNAKLGSTRTAISKGGHITFLTSLRSISCRLL